MNVDLLTSSFENIFADLFKLFLFGIKVSLILKKLLSVTETKQNNPNKSK